MSDYSENDIDAQIKELDGEVNKIYYQIIKGHCEGSAHRFEIWKRYHDTISKLAKLSAIKKARDRSAQD